MKMLMIILVGIILGFGIIAVMFFFKPISEVIGLGSSNLNPLTEELIIGEPSIGSKHGIGGVALVVTNFTATTGGFLENISIYAAQAGGAANGFAYAVVYSDNNGVPDTLLVNSSNQSAFDGTAKFVNFTIDPTFILAKGTTYWFGMFHDAKIDHFEQVNTSHNIEINDSSALDFSLVPSNFQGSTITETGEVMTIIGFFEATNDTSPPNVTLQSPEDNFTATNETITFIGFVEDDTNISKVELFGNWSGTFQLEATNTSEINNVNYTFVENTLQNFQNQSNGFSTVSLGSSRPKGITTNGTDFWIVDEVFGGNENFVYHTDKDGNNITDGFPVTNDSRGIATNGTDFWVTDFVLDIVRHYDSSGTPIDNFSVGDDGSNFPKGITTNGTDLWVLDSQLGDQFVYHFTLNGTNITDGFSIASIVNDARGIAWTGKDFYITDEGDNFVYHVSLNGTNITDGFSMSDKVGSGAGGSPYGIVTNLESVSSGDHTDIAIVSETDDFVYRLQKPTNGTFLWGMCAEDVFGNEFCSNNRTFTVSPVPVNDTTPPTVTLISPANDSTTTTNLTFFNANFTDDIFLLNTTLFIFNSTALIGNNFTNISGTSNSTNLSFVLPRGFESSLDTSKLNPEKINTAHSVNLSPYILEIHST